jgi:hypothetical protein
MSPHILALDIASAPHRWINVRDRLRRPRRCAQGRRANSRTCELSSNDWNEPGGPTRKAGLYSC